MLGLPMLEGTNPASCFPSSAIGYEAACYSRVWSEVNITLQACKSVLEFALLLMYICLTCSNFIPSMKFDQCFSLKETDVIRCSWTFMYRALVTFVWIKHKQQSNFCRFSLPIFSSQSFVVIFWTNILACSSETR